MMNEWHEQNPFTDEFMEQEVAFYMKSFPSSGDTILKNKNMLIRLDSINGRCDDYLNKAWRVDSVKMPILYLNNKIWMSLSYMEVQSGYLPIQFATGEVATCGLGLGYFTLRAMEKDDVESVTVFERNVKVINFFKNNFADRKGFDKVKFVRGDARKKCVGHKFDFLYVDTYETLLPDEVIDDAKLFTDNNNLTEGVNSYHFWGMERVILDAFMQWELISRTDLNYHFCNYVGKWFNSPIEGDFKNAFGGEQPRMHQLYEPVCDPVYAANVLRALDYEINENKLLEWIEIRKANRYVY